ncbi:MAG TPA: YXWGXW repeat-containing protein [Terracidiphilus sp.]|nr:YXWGXW repeat-containing protein [Terracidiphilus sp.]
MRLFHSARWILMTLLLCLVPASSYAGVFISVGFAPPVLPVYVQPVCPEPGLMWTPGYWGYGPDGYYWVPGAWVPAPYVGALWTPGYWGWSGGLYVWHGGYWGPHVGYYGGVNYGFGYMGVGFAGGVWRGGVFAYNSAVMHVGVGGGWGGGRVYEDRTIVERTTIINNTHVSYNGGPGGINHAPSADERMAMNEHHLAPTSFQTQHANAAMADHNAYAKFNGGHPANAAVSRPLAAESHPAPTFNNNRPTGNSFNNNHSGGNSFNNSHPAGNSYGSQARPMNQNNYHPVPQNQPHPQNQNHPQGGQPHQQSRPEAHEHGKGR